MFYRLLHGLAVHTSSAAVFIWECAGALEAWCDARTERRRWLRWAKANKLKVIWFSVPELDPHDFSMPDPDQIYVVPRKLRMLDDEEEQNS